MVAQGFRTAELAGGFRGHLATTELFILLDAVPVSLAMLVLNVFHPCRLLPAGELPGHVEHASTGEARRGSSATVVGGPGEKKV